VTEGSVDPPTETPGRESGLIRLSLLALIVGLLAGLVGAAFRLTLESADGVRAALITWAHGAGAIGFPALLAACAGAAFVAARLVRRFSSYASGSGIPHVEAVLHGQAPPAPFVLLPVKFVGGAPAIGSGLALGREGPSVQMGAVVGHLLGEAFRLDATDCRALLAAGAGAGLATAFNAPMAGAVFVLEELTQKFDQRVAIVALAASATAIATAHLILTDAPDFDLPALSNAAPAAGPLFFVLGAAAGLLGIVYNRALLATLAQVERLRRFPVEVRAGLIGAAVGALAWFAPGWVGGGDALTQSALLGAADLFVLPFILLLRLCLGSLSYAAATPGGLFAPLLALGAQFGLLFGAACGLLFPSIQIQPQAFAVVGMTALFTGAVRAPLTGIVLVTEMTGSAAMLLPMLGACFTAMLMPTLLRNPPIYDSLRERLLKGR
jgi:chloride channel protein, CIC family